MFTYWAEACHWVLHQWDQELKKTSREHILVKRVSIFWERSTHSKWLGNTAQIFTDIREDENTSMAQVKFLLNGQLCMGAQEPGGVSSSFPCPIASHLLPVTGSRSPPVTLGCSCVWDLLQQELLMTKPRPGAGFDLAFLLWQRKALIRWWTQERAISAPSAPVLGKERGRGEMGTPLLGWAVLCATSILFGKLKRDLEKKKK